jgi:hypothetical protein
MYNNGRREKNSDKQNNTINDSSRYSSNSGLYLHPRKQLNVNNQNRYKMNTKDLSRFRTLRIFITIATLSGLDVLFFMMAEYTPARFVMLLFLNVGVGFAIYWLMDYASSPSMIPEDTTLLRKENKRYKKTLHMSATKTAAMWLALAEVEIMDVRKATIYTRYDTDARCSCLWVINQLTLKQSSVYHYKKDDTIPEDIR